MLIMDISILTPDDEFTPGASWSGHDWLDGSTSPEEHFLDNKKPPRTLTPNLTRRSHKKSRNGCFSCKTRKIKCDEAKPLCTQCKLKSVDCQYPANPPRRELSNNIRRPNQPLASSPMTAQFTLNDMQFFHHFLTISFPHLPLGNEDVWLRDIPQFAQSHTYLMHAILALGASHLNRLTPGNGYEKEALTHRGHAINGLNTCMAKSLSHHASAYGEADAMLATCYALTFQASYMADGLSDFVIFVRGCALATGKIRDENAPTAFNLAPNRHHSVIRPRLQSLPQLNPIHVDAGLSALDEVQVYLHNSAERKFFTSLRDVFVALQQSPAAGYLCFVNLYRVWYELDHDAFKVFLDSGNSTVQILLGFFIGIQMVMAPLTAHEWPERTGVNGSGSERSGRPGETIEHSLGINSAGSQSLLGMADWMESVASKVPEELQWHLAWSRNLVGTVVAELSGLPYSGPPVLYMGGKESLSAGSSVGTTGAVD